MPETTGLVQRLKWADPSQALFLYLGPLPSDVRLFLLSFDANDSDVLATRRAMAHLLAKAHSEGLSVTVQHDATNSDITSVETQYSAVRPDGIEVTQAIQNLLHTVPLIALKTTVARVYLSYRLSPPITVRGELVLRRPPSGASVTVPSLNTVVLDAAQFGQVDARRRDAQQSLNFLLPVDQTAPGPLEIRLTRVLDANTGTPYDIGRVGFRLSVNFLESPPLRVRILGISYQQGTPPVTHIPSALDFGLVQSWLQRAYPVARVISSQAIVPANAAVPFTCGQVNAQVATIRALDVAAGADPRTHYYGLVSDGGFFMRGCAAIPATADPSAIGSGPTGPATWGWDFDGSYGDWYTGHELGHTFGRLHPGACGESNDDLNYPFINGQLANADNRFVGFDVGDPIYDLPMAALPGVQWHDVMTYCPNQWLSSYTYQGIRTRLVAENNLGLGPSPGPGGGAGRPDERFPERAEPPKAGAARQNLISVVATVNLTQGTGRIEYVNPVPQGEVTPPDPDSPVILHVRRADGQAPRAYPVRVKPLSDQEQDRLGLVDAIIAVDPDARIIELSISGRPVDTFRGGAPSPALRNIHQVQAAPPALAFAWETDARPGDNLTYIVQASTDHGRSWQTLAVGLTTPQVTIDRSQFQGARHVLIRVIATDGFTRSEVSSERLPIDTD